MQDDLRTHNPDGLCTHTPDELRTHYRACHLCEAICGLEIVTRGADILAIKGDKQDPFSHGHICPKATALLDLHTDPDRLRRPRKKTASGWQDISWEEAYETVASRLVAIQAAHGNDAVAVYAGNPNVHNYGNLTHGGLFRKALKTKSNYSATSLDQLPHQLVAWWLYGHQAMLPVPDIDSTDLMLIIGGNPLASNGSLMTVPDVKHRLQAIQQRGGRIIVIDPRRTETAEIADEHHFIRPGSDAFLLLAMMQVLFSENLVQTGHLGVILRGIDAVKSACEPFTPELAAQQTGIAADVIRGMARDLAGIPKAVVYGRMGVSVQAFGTLCQWAIQALNILTGKLDVVGGALVCSPAFGYVEPGTPGPGHFGMWKSRVSGLPEFAGELPTATLSEEILTPGEGQIRALVTIAGNPVLSAPNGTDIDKALEQLDFMVAIDFYLNETTRHADIILPPTGPLEHDHYDIVFHRLAVRNTTRYNPPVFDPEPGARHDWEIFNQLSELIATKKGTPLQALPAPHLLLDRGIQSGHYSHSKGHALALTLDKIKAYPHGLDLGPLQPSLSSRLCTDDGLINLAVELVINDLPRLLARQAVIVSDDALLLIGRRHVRSNNSWMHNSHRLVKGKPRWQLLMHPADMAARSLTDNASVIIKSRVGEVVTEVIGSDAMMPGVVSLPHGWGHQREGIQLAIAARQGGKSANDLTDEKAIDQLSGNSVFNGVPVTVNALPCG
jgi:anaerobic selenocysteine-containing dehydrogenase